MILEVEDDEEELLDRILAVVHGNVTEFEPQKQDSYCLVFSGLSIDGLHHTVLCDGREIELTHLELDLSKAYMIEVLWREKIAGAFFFLTLLTIQ